MADVHPNAVAVLAAARQLGLSIAHAQYPDGTATAQHAADAIGCDVAQIVKSLVFVLVGSESVGHGSTGAGETVLALVSGANQLDEKRLAAVAGAKRAKRADADQVRAATGYPIGGVPPFGLATELRVFADEALLGHELVWAAAGTPRDVFSVAPAALATAVGATVATIRRG